MNWLFTDMDAYFASVEQTLRPELRGRPVGVIPVETDSTCVIAASYDAKRRGVKVGTGVREARQLCPEIALVKARPHMYVQMHHRILASVDQCAPIEHVYSIDEWSIRLQPSDQNPTQAAQLGWRIKQRIHDDFGPWLTCSVGIAATRLLAKIACGLRKPDCLVVLPTSELPDRLEHLELQDLCGISHGMLARLNRHGVQTIRELWNLRREEAVQIWGSITGGQWWAGLHGLDELEPTTRRRSMSHGSVLAPRLRPPEQAHAVLVRLLCKLAERLRRSGYYAQRLSLLISAERGARYSQETGFPYANDTLTLLQHLGQLWATRPTSVVRIKKLDLCVSRLALVSQVPRPLFDEFHNRERMSQIIDEINLRWGTLAVYYGSVHGCREPMENKIAFGRIPDVSE